MGQGHRVKKGSENKQLPAGWIEQPTSSLRVTRSTTELSGLRNLLLLIVNMARAQQILVGELG